MIETVGTAIHVLMSLIIANDTFTAGKRIVLGPIRKTIPLPVVDLIILHPLNRHLLELFHIARISDINRTSGLGTIAGRSDNIRKRRIIVISTARTNPYTKVGTKCLHQLRARCQSLRELGVELPEAGCIYIRCRSVTINIILRTHRTGSLPVQVPSIIHNIGLQRTHTRL